MAEVIKKKSNNSEYKINVLSDKEKEEVVKKTSKKKRDTKEVKKENLWTKFRIFCHGVNSETKKVHWTSKEDIIKYSTAAIALIIFCSIFFYIIDIIFAFVQSLFA